MIQQHKNKSPKSSASRRTRVRQHFHKHGKKHLTGLLVAVAATSIALWALGRKGNAAGIDDVSVTLSNESTSSAAQVTVGFTFGSLVDGNTIKIYLGETTGGNYWGLNSVTMADIACSDNGTGEAYTVNSVAAASGSAPLWTQITATTVGSGATTVTCTIGDNSPNPTNPTVAGNYSVAVVTTNDSGAGIAYVGNANDVTVSANALPNLTLTIDNPDATICSTTLGITSCNLGVITIASVNSGTYDVNVGTNAASGASIRIGEDGDLRNGSDTIDDIVEDAGGTVTAGSEEYGISVIPDASWVEQGNFTDDDTPIPTGPTTVATASAPIDLTGDDISIAHKVAVASSTKALTYSHIVTWSATPNF